MLCRNKMEGISFVGFHCSAIMSAIGDKLRQM